MMRSLTKSLNKCSNTHRDKILHIPFEHFILKQRFRENLAKIIGADSIRYKPSRFISSQSEKNVGIWKEWHSKEDIEYISNKLQPIIDFCLELKPFNLKSIYNASITDDEVATLNIMCAVTDKDDL